MTFPATTESQSESLSAAPVKFAVSGPSERRLRVIPGCWDPLTSGWALEEQSSREQPPALSTTRARDGSVPTDEDAAEIVAVHGSVHNHFVQERHLVSRKIKQRRAAALAAWQAVMA
jgi:hypothetical protein